MPTVASSSKTESEFEDLWERLRTNTKEEEDEELSKLSKLLAQEEEATEKPVWTDVRSGPVSTAAPSLMNTD